MFGRKFLRVSGGVLRSFVTYNTKSRSQSINSLFSSSILCKSPSKSSLENTRCVSVNPCRGFSVHGVPAEGAEEEGGVEEKRARQLGDLTRADTPTTYHLSGVQERSLVPEGCPAVTQHFQKSKSRQLMLRSAFFRLLDFVAPEDSAREGKRFPNGKQLFLQGRRGSGKSVLLAQMVHWARSQGWLVLYVPNSEYYLSNSNFSKHSSGMTDTPETACELLKSLQLAHGPLLDSIRLSDGSGSLGNLVGSGASYTSHGTEQPDVMSITMKVLDLLETQDLGVPVMLALDNFNHLFAGSAFYEWEGVHKRVVVPAAQLRLVAKLRDMSASTPLSSTATRIVATSASAPISPRVQMLGVPFEARRQLACFDNEEIKTYISHLRECGVSRYGPEDKEAMAKFQFLSGGDALQLRLITCVL
mmetsp:Transcript_32595/g.45228  ORF Transcript_32595/g.45228 Transcript_32595/m.45228 type:complete len:416 (+) Transcript_32595:92-1339(+)